LCFLCPQVASGDESDRLESAKRFTFAHSNRGAAILREQVEGERHAEDRGIKWQSRKVNTWFPWKLAIMGVSQGGIFQMGNASEKCARWRGRVSNL